MRKRGLRGERTWRREYRKGREQGGERIGRKEDREGREVLDE